MRAPRIIGLVVGSIALAAVLFLFVLPSRTYLAQHQSLVAAQTRLKLFQRENAKLSAEANQLQTDSDVERIAREQYGLVKPGEKAFVIVPAAPSVEAGAAPAGTGSAGDRARSPRPVRRGLLSRLWHDVQFWH